MISGVVRLTATVLTTFAVGHGIAHGEQGYPEPRPTNSDTVQLIVPKNLQVMVETYPADWEWQQSDIKEMKRVREGEARYSEKTGARRKYELLRKSIKERRQREKIGKIKTIKFKNRIAELRPGPYKYQALVQTRGKYGRLHRDNEWVLRLGCILEFTVEPGYRYDVRSRVSRTGKRYRVHRSSRAGLMVKSWTELVRGYQFYAAVYRSSDGIKREEIATCTDQ